ncbi:IS5 family transposase [Aliifodinibius sp. S!AR15-10]|nr:IS5 family transposase [Aliifodinibius sp. S!AR15-10]
MFSPILKSFIDPKHPLVQLADRLDWSQLETEFAELYSETGRPAHPIRLMVSLLLLKQMYGHGDESLPDVWIQNPYYQYFSGMDRFQWRFPVAPSDLSHFRGRLGPAGMEKIFGWSVALHGKKAREKTLCVDTTVQETNITFPTDAKLYGKVMGRLRGIAKDAGIKLKQSYRFVGKKLLRASYNGSHPKRATAARKATRKLRTCAGRLLREVQRRLPEEVTGRHQPVLELCQQVLDQQRYDKNKVYSLHEPHTACIAKGKAHKKYEFGRKVSLAITANSQVLVGATMAEGNAHDSKTLEDTLRQYHTLTDRLPEKTITDRGYRGLTEVLGVQVWYPDRFKAGKDRNKKRRLRRWFRKRTAIEPPVGHLKSDYGLDRSYLKGADGAQMNLLLAATAWNLQLWMRQLLCWLKILLRFVNPLSSWTILKPSF